MDEENIYQTQKIYIQRLEERIKTLETNLNVSIASCNLFLKANQLNQITIKLLKSKLGLK